MENQKVVVLDEGMDVQEIADNMACCKPNTPAPQ